MENQVRTAINKTLLRTGARGELRLKYRLAVTDIADERTWQEGSLASLVSRNVVFPEVPRTEPIFTAGFPHSTSREIYRDAEEEGGWEVTFRA